MKKRRPREALTDAQARDVEEALTAVRAIARSLARRCSRHTVAELETLAEDSLMQRVRHHDRAKGKLIDFARQGVRLDLIRAAYQRAHDPCVAAGLHGMDLHEEAIQPVDTAVRFAETLAEKEARALGLGRDLMAAAHGGHLAARASRSPESEVADREAWAEWKAVAARISPEAATILVLLYEQDQTWEQVAAALGMSARQAQRVHARTIKRLRAQAG